MHRDEPKKVATFHSGSVTLCITCPRCCLLLTTGTDCTLRIYNYISFEEVLIEKLPNQATSILWIPEELDETCCSILIGFCDGFFRKYTLTELKLDVRTIIGQLENMHSIAPMETMNGEQILPDVSMVLTFALRPHMKAIRCMKFNYDNSLLAISSDDLKIFLLDAILDYAPIGFVNTPAIVTCLTWSPIYYELDTLLIGCQDGNIMEVNFGDEIVSMEMATSFLLEDVYIKRIKFDSRKSQIRHDFSDFYEDSYVSFDPSAVKTESTKNESLIPDDPNLEEISVDDEEDEVFSNLNTDFQLSSVVSESKLKIVEEVWTPEIPEKPSAVRALFYARIWGTFWVIMDDYDSGLLYECVFDEDTYVGMHKLRYVDFHIVNDIPVTSCIICSKEEYLFMGLKDGSIVSKKCVEGDLCSLDGHCRYFYHDDIKGDILNLCLSGDERYLFSVGCDGNIFMYDCSMVEDTERQVDDVYEPLPKFMDVDAVEDIVNPGYLSLEEVNLLKGRMRILKQAEELKEKKRLTLSLMLEKYNEIKKLNEEIPELIRMHPRELLLDDMFIKKVEENKKKDIEILNKMMAWRNEKCDIAYNKLKNKYRKSLESDYSVLYPFNGDITLKNYRLKHIKNTAQFESIIQTHDYQNFKDNNSQATTNQNEDFTKVSDVKVITKVKLKGSQGRRKMAILQKMAEKRQKRENRRNEWADFYATRKTSKYIDPEDQKCINEARANIGYLKLKSSSEYRLPEGKRMTVSLIKKNIIDHINWVYNTQKKFNGRFNALRSKKIQLLALFKKLSAYFKNVQKFIPDILIKSIPIFPESLALEEFPEKRYIFTNKNFVNFVNEQDDTIISARMRDLAREISENEFEVPREYTEISNNIKLMNVTKEDILMDPVLFIQKDEQERCLHDQDKIINAINLAMKNFNAELKMVRNDKFKLDILLKAADLRLLARCHELACMKELEPMELVLSDSFKNKKNEHTELFLKVSDLQDKLDTCILQINNLVELEKKGMQAFLSEIPDNYKFTQFLTKVYKKKYKRMKRIPSQSLMEQMTKSDEEEDQDDLEEDDDDTSLDSIDDDEDEDDEYMDLDKNQPGCDQGLYDKVVLMRETRLDILDELKNKRQMRDQLTKEIDNSSKKLKILDAAYRQAEELFDKYQISKQMALNEVLIVVMITFRQIEYVNVSDENMIQNLTDALLISETEMARLSKRISEIQMEIVQMENHKKLAKRQHVLLVKMKLRNMYKIKLLQRDFEDHLLKKFGVIVDLEKIESILVVQELEELKQEADDVKARNKQAIKNILLEITEAKWEQSESIRMNTDLLDHIRKLSLQKYAIEENLNSRIETSVSKLEPVTSYRDDYKRMRRQADKNCNILHLLSIEKRNLSTKSTPLIFHPTDFSRSLDRQPHNDY